MSLLKARLAAEPGCPLVHVGDYKLSMKGKVVCPQCDGDVVAKMGFKNVHHFAHKSKTQCDSWTEPMTAWHKGWQDLFKPENVEVIMTCNNVKHIADVMYKGHVLEIQHSQISAAELMDRESFYTRYGNHLIWIVDGHSEKDCVILGTTSDGYAAIWARRSWWWHAKNPVLIDANEGLFQVIRYYEKNVGLAEPVTTLTWHGVAGGLTVSGAQILQDRMAARCWRVLTTSYTSAYPVVRAASSRCHISGDTYPHRELFKKLGMMWYRGKWECEGKMWHEIAEQIYYWLNQSSGI